MKKTITYIVIGLLIFTESCSNEFLEANPKDSLASNVFFTSVEDANLALSGCYDALQEDYLFALRNQNDASLRERETFTDNATNGFLYQRFNNIKTGQLTAADPIPIERPWRALYRGIGRVNEVIKYVPQMASVPAEDKNLILAQAKAMRALFYWHLTEGWDDVPLILSPVDKENTKIPKNSALEIYNAMVADLEEAASILPNQWTGDNYGRITAGAANALLARIHLYFYGYNNVADGAEKALLATEKVINSGLYTLFPDFEELFTVNNEDNAEVIWSVRFSENLGGNNMEGFSFSFNDVPQTTNQPLPNFVADFYCIDGLPIDQSPLYNPNAIQNNRDPRWDATIVYPNEQWLDNRPPFNIAPAIRRSGYAIDKYVINNNDGIQQGVGGQDWYIFRLADVLLMRAEALIETGNTGQEVYDLINQVRGRVSMPKIEDVEGSGLSAIELTAILRHERRVELAFENTRFMDLKRWGTMEQAYINCANDVKVGGNNPIVRNISFQGERSLVLPIPQSELDANSALEQHPAWK